jgi:hypothetical protein|nr:MAG TPA: hypothetical protein [Caudoviricetes sp.]
MILEELFTDVATLREYVPFMDSNIAFSELGSSAKSAKKQICVIITPEVYSAIIGKGNGSIFEELRTAVANLTLAKQVVFDAINRRKQEIDIYKHEQESMRRAYIENYYNSMDSLVQELEKSDIESWKETRYKKILESLRIKTAPEFDELYPIDGSYLFFFRIIPFQREALEDYMNGYYSRVSDDDESKNSIYRKLDRCLAMYTVAKSLRQFDIVEFPSTIRNLFEDSKAMRYGTQEQERVLALSEQLKNEADQLLRDIDTMLSNSEGGNVSTEESYLLPSDKFYLMP